MNDLVNQITNYLRHVLGLEVKIVPWEQAARLPAFLLDRYRAFQGTILHQPVIFLADHAPDQESPAHIRKHIAQVLPKSGWPVIYVCDHMNAYNRKRLIEQGVPFLVPGNQMYLPDLGIDLRERSRRQARPRGQFRPATQAVFIYAILHDPNGPLTAANLGPKLGYSAMSVGRAFDDIVAAELAETRTIGRERNLMLTAPRRELWKRAQVLLKSPVKKRHVVLRRSHDDPSLRAGLSALAEYSMLAAPKNPVVAMSREHWASLRQRGAVTELPVREPDACEVETWTYMPRPFRTPGIVDPLSLYLSLRPATDERVEQALDHMMEALDW